MKPELAQDPTLAKVSREARYTFVLLWTVADDEGFFRASLRYLLGVLYPHDPDVTPDMLKGWLKELADIGRIAWRELSDGSPVGSIVNWKKHQRIDHPSKSFIRENLAKGSRDPREGVPKGVLSLESRVLSPESSKSSTSLVPSDDTEAIEAASAARKTKEQALHLGAEVVFRYWRARMGKTDRTILDRKREVRLVQCLRQNGGDVSELLYAVDGALRDDYLMGRDPRAPRRYDGIETLFRDRAQIERLVGLVRGRADRHPFISRPPNGNGADA